jgi:hypothetical protein
MPLVAIARFDDAYEGEIAAGRLRDAGIEVFFRNEGLGTIDPLLQRATGGYPLSVLTDDVEEARALLREFIRERPQSPVLEDDDEDDDDIAYDGAARRRRNRLTVLIMLGIFVGPVILTILYGLVERLIWAVGSLLG